MIVVTGGAGFIGSATVWQLNQQGEDNIVIVDELQSSDKWKNLCSLKFKDYFEKDVFLKLLFDQKIPNIDAIIHLGACSSTTERDASYLVNNNFTYSKTLISYALENDIRMIYASSAATYGNGEQGYTDDESHIDLFRPLNMYGYSKQMLDLWAYHNNILDQVVSLKYFNVFGPNEYHKGDMRSMVHKAVGQILDEGSVKLFKSYRPDYKDGEQKRDFVYVKDAVKMTLHFLEKRDVGGIFNIGTGEVQSWNALMMAIFEACGKPVQIEYIDMPDLIRDQYQYFTQAAMTKIEQAGYQQPCMTLLESVKDYVQNYILKEAYLS